MEPRRLVILGSTGSVGRSTLDVVARHPDRYQVVGLTAHRNAGLLAEQCHAHGAGFAVISDEGCRGELQQALNGLGCSARVRAGAGALSELIEEARPDTVMAAIVGAAGLRPTLHAVERGLRVLLANKESMVIAGALFDRAQRNSGADIIPVDSEHNALFQSLPAAFRSGLASVGVERLILTASGGPFLDHAPETLHAVTPEQACAHPNWDMGDKISVDSATLMNKGLEVIEARWLFNAEPGQIEVVIHPQSIVHSMVAYRDGSVLAQLGLPDMRTPIAHALAWPERIESGVKHLDLTRCGPLEFRTPDLQRFPCLGLAFEALAAGGNAPVVLNAANEEAVDRFLKGAIGFMQIPEIVGQVMERLLGSEVTGLTELLECDRAAREAARQFAGQPEVSHV